MTRRQLTPWRRVVVGLLAGLAVGAGGCSSGASVNEAPASASAASSFDSGAFCAATDEVNVSSEAWDGADPAGGQRVVDATENAISLIPSGAPDDVRVAFEGLGVVADARMRRNAGEIDADSEEALQQLAAIDEASLYGWFEATCPGLDSFAGASLQPRTGSVEAAVPEESAPQATPTPPTPTPVPPPTPTGPSEEQIAYEQAFPVELDDPAAALVSAGGPASGCLNGPAQWEYDVGSPTITLEAGVRLLTAELTVASVTADSTCGETARDFPIVLTLGDGSTPALVDQGYLFTAMTPGTSVTTSLSYELPPEPGSLELVGIDGHVIASWSVDLPPLPADS